MRICFAGTPEFAATALAALIGEYGDKSHYQYAQVHAQLGDQAKALASLQADCELLLIEGKEKLSTDIINEISRVMRYTPPAKAGADLRLAPDPAEVMATDWVGLDRLADEVQRQPERFTPWLRIYLTEHRSRIFG